MYMLAQTIVIICVTHHAVTKGGAGGRAENWHV